MERHDFKTNLKIRKNRTNLDPEDAKKKIYYVEITAMA